MMTNFSQPLLSSFNASMDYNTSENIMAYNDDGVPVDGNSDINYLEVVTGTICLLISPPGLLGNGIVIWLLGFRVKRNPFTVYIFNLSIADFGVLTTQATFGILIILQYFHLLPFFFNIYIFLHVMNIFTFIASNFLLIVISVDRCVCVFFPLWHRCHRPPLLSTAVCVMTWILTLIFTTGAILLDLLKFVFLLNTVLLTPIMCVSTLAMLTKVRLRSLQQKRGKMLRAILLTLLFFLLFAFPINGIHSLSFLKEQYLHVYAYGYVCFSLNSAINPLIYYLVGRGNRGRSSKRLNKVLEKLFKEEEDCRENQETLNETQL
ncbi:proto-oncogene Mas [Anolis carolinensis]|uniref:proto-oncogene Mas n=1 Tax=Anolis carolinensis TaxID=28377 RepID=UPI002F2B318A